MTTGLTFGTSRLMRIRRTTGRIRRQGFQSTALESNPVSFGVLRVTFLLLFPNDERRNAASPSPHSPAQSHIIQRYGRAEYVGAVGAG